MTSEDPNLKAPEGISLRALVEPDFEAVVALDERIAGRTRRGYLQRRLKAALRAPDRHVQLAAVHDGHLAGFALARVARGEFGRSGEALVLETIGVSPVTRRLGVGSALVRGLEGRARARAIGELATQVAWTDRDLSGFFAARGFTLAPRQVLERAVTRLRLEPDESGEPDPLRGVRVRVLVAGDLQALVRIDQRITGRDRGGYFRQKVDESLSESSIQVSLVAEEDRAPIGFVMARVDLGDFGHVGPVAVLDTLGVDPRFGGKGVGTALLYALLTNLSALLVDAIETEVSRDSFSLLGFLYRCGFGPSQRLALEKRLA